MSRVCIGMCSDIVSGSSSFIIVLDDYYLMYLMVLADQYCTCILYVYLHVDHLFAQVFRLLPPAEKSEALQLRLI